MKITYFRLKGYIKVLNGMGLDEVIINFSEFKNRIILIQGENGCSKSTILAAMTPNPDSSDEFRTDVFIDEFGNRQIIEYPGEKEIHYIDKDENGNVNIYKILIQSLVDDSRTRRTTKAFISKNDEEMNPNGNVTSFKEIRDSLLGIDPIYLDLSSISAENKGIVDMIPSERRKYMAAYIGSLETYNNIFKVISKKVTTLKSYINTLQGKIYSIGDENELRLQLMQAETAYQDLNKERDEYLKQLAEAEATIKIIDPDNKMQDLYASISDRLGTLNFEMKQNEEKLGRLYRQYGFEPKFENIRQDLEEVEKDLSFNESKLSENKGKISTLITLNETTLSKLDSDRTILEGLKSNFVQTNIESAVDALQKDIDIYNSYLTKEDIKSLKNLTLDELEELRENLTNFNNEILAAEELYTEQEFIVAVEAASEKETTLTKDMQEARQKATDIEIEISGLINDLKNARADLDSLNSFSAMRPKDCTIDTCPYIAKYIDIGNKGALENNINKLDKKIQALKDESFKMNSIANVISHSLEIARYINNGLSMINSKKKTIGKIKQLEYLNNLKSLKEKLIAHYRFPDFEIISSLIEKLHIYNDLQEKIAQLNELTKNLDTYKNNKALIESLESSIEKNQNEYDGRQSEINNINIECNHLSELVVQLTQKKEALNAFIEYDDNRIRLENDKANLKQEFESVKDKIKLVKDKMDAVNDIKNSITNIENSINPLSEQITQLKFNLTNIVEFQNDMKESTEKYDKILFIRNACSPGNGLGIQSEYIKRYMNDIIINCNQMLSYMFNGYIQLDVPVINEKQFAIPFVGPGGILVPDISNGSTAQKCMIGLVFSCVAMMKSSLKYNIPRFDEIDGGLDQQNRVTFIEVLNKVLDFMGSEQAILISHNMEFQEQETTRIICTHRGFSITQ